MFLMPMTLRVAMAVAVSLPGALSFRRVLLDGLNTLGDALNLILTAIVLPLQRLQVGQVISASKGHGHNMINLPAVAAPDIAKVLPHNRPSPGVYAQRLIDTHGA